MTDPNLDYARQLDAERRSSEQSGARFNMPYSGDPQSRRAQAYFESPVADKEHYAGPDPRFEWWQFSARNRYERELRVQQKARVLGSISNSRVRDLVEEAYKAANRHHVRVRWIRSGRDYLDRAQGVTLDARTYRNWLWKELQGSDLAQLLPGGREGLPDIYEAMSEPWRSLEKLFEPRSYKQLLAHVVRHLDWYLDPTQKPKPPIWQVSSALAVLVIIAVLGALWHFGIRIGGYWWGSLAKGLAAAFAALGARFAGGQKVGDRKVHNFYRVRGLINAAELYYYLAETYADVEESPQGELVSS